MSAVRSAKGPVTCENVACRKVFAPFQLNQRFCSSKCSAQGKRKTKAPSFAIDALVAVMGTRRIA